MCEPTTIALVATAVSAAGAGYQGYQSYRQGRYEQAVANQNAALERSAALDAEERGQRDEIRRWREIAQTKSAQIAAFAANGFDTSFGSASDVVADTLVLGREDARIVRENAGREARGHLISAQNFTGQGQAAARRGRAGATASIFNVGATILGGASQLQGYAPANSGARWGGSNLPNSAFKW